jgi:hypothetical protein
LFGYIISCVCVWVGSGRCSIFFNIWFCFVRKRNCEVVIGRNM